MKEVLYRGKRIDNDEWITGMPWIFSPPIKKALIVSAMGLVGEDDGVSRYCESDEVHPETIGQFTGGVDKAGKRIFEADIVQGICDLTGELIIGYVEYYPQTMKYCVHSNDNIVGLSRCRNIKVIGNIYDNSELLEVGE